MTGQTKICCGGGGDLTIKSPSDLVDVAANHHIFLYCETSSHNVKDAIVVKLVFLKVVNVTDNTPSINTIRLRNNDEVHPVKFSL